MSIFKVFNKNYVKRFFMIDVKQGKIMYSDSERGVEVKPSYSALFRDIKGVKKNIVSMPYHEKLVEVSTVGERDDHYDKGPDKH